MAGTLKARIYMVGSTSAIEVDIKDKEKFFQEFFLRFGYKLNSKEINEMISSTDLVDTKFNIGKINRGQTIPLEAKDHIKKIVSIFKDINFELIGIDQL